MTVMDGDTASPDTKEGCSGNGVLADSVSLDAKRMFENIALSKAPIKNQQMGEEDLPTEQRIKILEDLFKCKPGVFLEKYHPYLCEDDLPCFDHMSDVYEVQFYLKETRRRLKAGGTSLLVKNRRYEALKKLEAEGSYFSDDEMRSRDPLMYEQLVGQYLTDEELQETRAKIDPSDLKFSTILTTFIGEQQTKALQQRQQELEDAAEEEEEEEEEDEPDDKMELTDQQSHQQQYKSPNRHIKEESNEDEDDEEEEEDMDEDGATSSRQRQPTPATEGEKAMLREEFLSHMRERFLSGEDQDFDYGAVDSNAEYDSLAIRGWDEEEKYFDEESPCDAGSGEGDGDSGQRNLGNARTDADGDDLDDYEKWTPQNDDAIK